MKNNTVKHNRNQAGLQLNVIITYPSTTRVKRGARPIHEGWLQGHCFSWSKHRRDIHSRAIKGL